MVIYPLAAYSKNDLVEWIRQLSKVIKDIPKDTKKIHIPPDLLEVSIVNVWA